jgi:hypothetical protein
LRNYRLSYLLYILLFSLVTSNATTNGEGRLLISIVPDSAEFYINGLKQHPDENNSFSVTPGPVLFEIKQRRVVVYSALFTIDSSEEKTIQIDCSDGCAFFHVTTEPIGATLSMNGDILGATPYMNRFLKPGEYSIMVTYPGYIPVIRRIKLTNNNLPVFSFKMEQTQAVKDSLFAVKKALRRRRQLISSTAFGGVGLATAIAGAYYEWKAYNYMAEMDKAYNNYKKAESAQECSKNRALYEEKRKSAQKPIRYRNVLYSAAGLCLIGFYLSFVF